MLPPICQLGRCRPPDVGFISDRVEGTQKGRPRLVQSAWIGLFEVPVQDRRTTDADHLFEVILNGILPRGRKGNASSPPRLRLYKGCSVRSRKAGASRSSVPTLSFSSRNVYSCFMHAIQIWRFRRRVDEGIVRAGASTCEGVMKSKFSWVLRLRISALHGPNMERLDVPLRLARLRVTAWSVYARAVPARLYPDRHRASRAKLWWSTVWTGQLVGSSILMRVFSSRTRAPSLISFRRSVAKVACS